MNTNNDNLMCEQCLRLTRKIIMQEVNEFLMTTKGLVADSLTKPELQSLRNPSIIFYAKSCSPVPNI